MITRDDLRDFVMAQLVDVDEFVRMFKYGCNRAMLISLVSVKKNKIFLIRIQIKHPPLFPQTLIGSGRQFANQICNSYSIRSGTWLLTAPTKQIYDRLAQAKLIDDGICIGSFLIEAGWLVEAADVLSMTLRLIVDQRMRHEREGDEKSPENQEMVFTHLECLTR